MVVLSYEAARMVDTCCMPTTASLQRLCLLKAPRRSLICSVDEHGDDDENLFSSLRELRFLYSSCLSRMIALAPSECLFFTGIPLPLPFLHPTLSVRVSKIKRAELSRAIIGLRIQISLLQ